MYIFCYLSVLTRWFHIRSPKLKLQLICMYFFTPSPRHETEYQVNENIKKKHLSQVGQIQTELFSCGLVIPYKVIVPNSHLEIASYKSLWQWHSICGIVLHFPIVVSSWRFCVSVKFVPTASDTLAFARIMRKQVIKNKMYNYMYKIQ